jgi:superfamily I DNA and RNA helicase
LAQQTPRKTLFQSVHHDRRIAALRFAEEQMHVLGHDHITDNDKTIATADLLQHLEKEIAILPATQQRASLITTGGDKVQLSGAVVTMESVSHAAELAQSAAVCM